MTPRGLTPTRTCGWRRVAAARRTAYASSGSAMCTRCASATSWPTREVPSISTGFWVATTRNGRGTACGTPSTVTLRSSMTSSSDDWVLGEARLISSAMTMLANTGPGWNSKPRVPWLKIVTPVTSEGSRSGVNWMRRHWPCTDAAIARARVVLPTPGTSSSRMCPSARSAVSASRTTCGLPRTTDSMLAASRATSSAKACTSSAVRVAAVLRGGACVTGRLSWFASAGGQLVDVVRILVVQVQPNEGDVVVAPAVRDLDPPAAGFAVVVASRFQRGALRVLDPADRVELPSVSDRRVDRVVDVLVRASVCVHTRVAVTGRVAADPAVQLVGLDRAGLFDGAGRVGHRQLVTVGPARPETADRKVAAVTARVLVVGGQGAGGGGATPVHAERDRDGVAVTVFGDVSLPLGFSQRPRGGAGRLALAGRVDRGDRHLHVGAVGEPGERSEERRVG